MNNEFLSSNLFWNHDGAGRPLIDELAAVDPAARIGSGTTIGPYAVVGPNVELGVDCVVHPHAVLEGPSIFGSGNEFFPFCCVGADPQDLRYGGEPTILEVGDGNIFREHVTANRGTAHGGGVTRIGNNNLLMAYVHVAHDCIIADRVVMANGTTIAGHVQVESHSVFGGGASVGTFLRIGESSMSAAGSMIEKDVPPFCTVGGDRARLRGVNRVGLMRRGFSPAIRKELKALFQDLYRKSTPLSELANTWSARDDLSAEARHLVQFIASAKRGVCR